jgi:hypothetical protein
MITLPDYLPAVLPAGWHEAGVMRQGPAVGYVYRSAFGLAVIVSVAEEDDGHRWLHVSCSRAERLPTWRELREVKELFVGRDRLALQVLPPEDEYVNVHPNVLHLWCRLGPRPVPDFRTLGGI